MPLEDRPRSCWIVGAAIETIVWSIKVMATAKIIAVRIRLRDWPPPVLLLIVPSLVWLFLADSQPVRYPAASHKFNGCRSAGAQLTLAHDKLEMRTSRLRRDGGNSGAKVDSGRAGRRPGGLGGRPG